VNIQVPGFNSFNRGFEGTLISHGVAMLITILKEDGHQVSCLISENWLLGIHGIRSANPLMQIFGVSRIYLQIICMGRGP